MIRAETTRLALAIFTFVLAGTLLAGCGKKSDAQMPGGPGGPGGPAMAVPVTVLTVQPSHVPMTVEAIGQTEGAKEVEVRPRVGGVLMKQLYQEGARVRAGQPLFEIDRAPLEIALSEASAERAQQQAKADQTARDAARLKPLAAEQAVSQKEYDDAVAAARLARAALQGSDAKVRDARLNLSYATVVAPVSGVSGRAQRSVGSLVAPTGDNLLTTIIQPDPIWVRFGLSDSDLARLPGQRLAPASIRDVQLILPGGAVYGASGRLNFSSTQIDPKLGTLQYRAAFPNPQNEVLPGQLVRVRLVAGDISNVYIVPQTAVMQQAEGHFVFVVGPGNKAAIRPVKTGEWQGENWVILSGLKSGDAVILDNLIKVKPGAPVKPKPREAAAQAPKPIS